MFFKNVYADNDTISLQEEKVDTLSPTVESSPYSVLLNMIPMVLIFMVFYFFLIRPQEKRRKEKANLILTIKKGEEVVTNSGIFGVITKINESSDTIELEIAENVRIKILKSSIVDIISRNKQEELPKSKKTKDNR